MPDVKLDEYAKLVWAALLDFIGQDNAIPGRDLAEMVGLTDERGLRLVVHYAREHLRRPICSLAGIGYFRPATLDEVDHCYRQIRRTALQQLRAAAVLRRLGTQELRTSDPWIDSVIAREGVELQEELFQTAV